MKSRSGKLLGGQLVGQVALVVAIPFLTRLMSAHEMGVYQAAFSVALVLSPVATLRRELLIPVSRTDDARRYRRAGLLFALALCAVIVLAALPLRAVTGPRIAEVALCTALILFSLALVSIENSYLIRHGEYGRLAARNLLAGVGAAALQILAALTTPSAVAVAGALLVGRLGATAATVARRPPSQPDDASGARTSQRSVSAILSAMIATASNQAVVLCSFGALGPAAAAQIGVGQRIGGAPTTLIGQALSQIALGEAAPFIREQKPGLVAVLRRQVLRTSAAASLTATALMIGGPLLAVPVLGEGWQQAGVLVAVFAVPLSFQLVALPATTLMIPLGRERRLLVLQSIRLCAVVGALVVAAALSRDVVTACIVTSVVWTAAYGPILAASFAAAAAHDRKLAP